MADANRRTRTLPPYGEAGRYPNPDGPLRGRIAALDVTRGLALCGILVANVQPIANAGRIVVPGPMPGDTAGDMAGDAGRLWLGLLVEHRFLPIFSLLFGIGFSLLLESAAQRTERPRVVLLRRLLALLGLGLAHMLLWRGDILSLYAVVGLVVLLPSTWLPRRGVAVLGGLLLAAAVAIGGDPRLLVIGLFLLGSALVRYGVIDRLDRSARVPAVLGALLAAAAVPAGWAQVRFGGEGSYALLFGLAGLLTAGVYVCALLLLLRTPLRRALCGLLAPLGRMALTNYLTGTVLVLLLAPAVGGRPEEWSAGTVCLLAAGILAIQWAASALWLRRFRQGPFEWLWRWATWGRRPPLRRLPKRQPRVVLTQVVHEPMRPIGPPAELHGDAPVTPPASLA